MAKNPKCPGCNGATNANGNCFSSGCWNSNDRRHEAVVPRKRDED